MTDAIINGNIVSFMVIVFEFIILFYYFISPARPAPTSFLAHTNGALEVLHGVHQHDATRTRAVVAFHTSHAITRFALVSFHGR